MSVYRRILRGAEHTCRYWGALEEEKCIGQHFHALRNLCEERGLSLSRHGHSVMSENQFYQVFMFAIEEHAEIFRKEFGGERMHQSEKGRGTHGRSGTRERTSRKPRTPTTLPNYRRWDSPS